MYLFVAAGVVLAVVLMSRARSPGAGREVPAERYRAATLGAYLRDLEAAYRQTDLPAEVVPLAVTHSAMATGAWLDLDPANMGARRTPADARYTKGGPRAFNNNIGVIRSTSGWDGDYARMGTDEIVDGERVHQLGQAFRAYPTLADSARDAVRLWRTRRYASAYALLAAGDPRWSGELGRKGYYTADPAVFEAGYRIRLDRVRAILGGAP